MRLCLTKLDLHFFSAYFMVNPFNFQYELSAFSIEWIQEDDVFSPNTFGFSTSDLHGTNNKRIKILMNYIHLLKDEEPVGREFMEEKNFNTGKRKN